MWPGVTMSRCGCGVAAVALRMLHGVGLDQRRDLLGGRVRDRILADDGDRRRLAAADARRVQDAHVLAEQRRQRGQQLARAGHLARDRVADAHGDRGRRRLAFLHHVEVVIEGRHFVDLGHRHLHLGRERDQVRRGEAAEAILNLVEVLDQQIPPARGIAEQREHVLARLRVDAAALRGRARALERLLGSSASPVFYSVTLAGGRTTPSTPAPAACVRPLRHTRRCRALRGSNWYTEDIMRVEFLGVPRERAGVAELELQADTLGQLLVALAVRFPSLGELITADRLQPSFVANLNGDRFVSDPRTPTREKATPS